MCVQNFDDSRGAAIRITYRISLRSSSLWEPRHPLLKVVLDLANTERGQTRPDQTRPGETGAKLVVRSAQHLPLTSVVVLYWFCIGGGRHSWLASLSFLSMSNRLHPPKGCFYVVSRGRPKTHLLP